MRPTSRLKVTGFPRRQRLSTSDWAPRDCCRQAAPLQKITGRLGASTVCGSFSREGSRATAAPSSRLFLALADRRWRLLVEILRDLKVMLERGQGLAGPILQVRIVAALGIALEQVDGVLVSADLH